MSTVATAPYEQLVAVIERELELASEGRFDELRATGAQWTDLIERLAATPPAGALPIFERALALHRHLTAELARGREALLREVAELERVRRAAVGYMPAHDSASRFSASA